MTFYLPCRSERYQLLPKISHKLRFFDYIQCQLLDYFVDEIKSQKGTLMQPFARFDYELCCKVLNSTSYVKDILAEWGEDLVRYFLKLKANTFAHGWFL